MDQIQPVGDSISETTKQNFITNYCTNSLICFKNKGQTELLN